MRLVFKILAIILIAGMAFLAGALTAGMRGWIQPLTWVTIENRSGQMISDLRLHHGTAGQSGTVGLKHLVDGASATLTLFIAGEGSYSLEVTLDDGTVLKGESAYVQSGNRTHELITKEGIKPSSDWPF